MNLNTLLDLASGVNQTQRDVHVLAETAEQFQSPNVQAELRSAKELAETYATVTLALQAITTIAIVGTFFLQLKNRK